MKAKVLTKVDGKWYQPGEKLPEEKTENVEEEKEPVDKKEPKDSKKENDQPTDEELEEMTSDELYEVAQDIKLEGRSGLRNDKDKLLAAVKEALAEKDGE